jgi:hypothetical protein
MDRTHWYSTDFGFSRVEMLRVIGEFDNRSSLGLQKEGGITFEDIEANKNDR